MPVAGCRSERAHCARGGARAALVGLALCAALACGCTRTDAAVDGGAADTDGPPPGGYPMPSGAPPLLACEIDDDCMVVTNLPTDRCCDGSAGYLPRSRAWLRWLEDQRKWSCAGAKCETLPLPGPEPQGCIREARCVARSCASACDAGDAGTRAPGSPPPIPPG